jgi:endo-1,4-beta-D-glucanase Y
MKKIIVVTLLLLNALAAQEAKYPFPQNVKYPHGTMTTVVTNEFVKSWYDSWKKKYLQTCGSNVMPGVDPLNKALVEAQGFSMVAVAYMGDKTTFDALYAFYLSKCTSDGCGLMGWKVTCAGFEDRGAATDGDIDVACGLVVASWQWPNSGYEEKAKTLITNLKKVITTCSGKLTIYPGCSGGRPWGGCNETDISYYSPAFFRYFAKVTGDESWAKLADDTHLIRDAAANATTGLVPDWQSVSGTAGAGSRKGYYSFDAIRAPYKQALDYIWNGNEKAGVWCKKLTSWAFKQGVATIKDGYQLNGTVQGTNHNMAVVGALGVASIANTQEVVDAFAKEMIKLKDDYWYSGYLGNLYLLAISGNMWNPDIVGKVSSARMGNRTAASKVHLQITNSAHRKLVLSGHSKRNIITLSTLSVQQVVSEIAQSDETSLNIAKLRPGCYILTLSNQQGQKLEGRVVSFY